MKNKIILIILGIILFLILSIIICYNFLLARVANDDEIIYFNIESGTSTREVVKDLKRADLIKSEYAVLFYIKIHHINIQAGTYELSRSMSSKEIFNKFNFGDISEDTINLTFVEGKRLLEYVKLIANNFSYSEDEIINVLNDSEYLKELINKYWFLTEEILQSDIYYPLEGYLYPDTYNFYKTATIQEIIETLLDNLDVKLTAIKDDILNSGYSVHELLSMASIVDLEGNTYEDRKTISQVIHSRLNYNMSLGMDVTTYYAAQVEIGAAVDYNMINKYNTRDTSGNMNGKLPIGPICNPSLESIEASLYPSDTSYLYFFADVYGNVHFATTLAEHNANINKYKW